MKLSRNRKTWSLSGPSSTINENFKEIGRNSLCWINKNVQPRECCDTREAFKDAFNQVGHWMGNSEEIFKCNNSEKSALCYLANAQTFQNEAVSSTLPTAEHDSICHRLQVVFFISPDEEEVSSRRSILQPVIETVGIPAQLLNDYAKEEMHGAWKKSSRQWWNTTALGRTGRRTN
jgi:hypothetical protein